MVGIGLRCFVGVFSLPVDLVFDFAQNKGTYQAIGYFLHTGFLTGGFFYKICGGLNTLLNTLGKQAGPG